MEMMRTILENSPGWMERKGVRIQILEPFTSDMLRGRMAGMASRMRPTRPSV